MCSPHELHQLSRLHPPVLPACPHTLPPSPSTAPPLNAAVIRNSVTVHLLTHSSDSVCFKEKKILPNFAHLSDVRSTRITGDSRPRCRNSSRLRKTRKRLYMRATLHEIHKRCCDVFFSCSLFCVVQFSCLM